MISQSVLLIVSDAYLSLKERLDIILSWSKESRPGSKEEGMERIMFVAMLFLFWDIAFMVARNPARVAKEFLRYQSLLVHLVTINSNFVRAGCIRNEHTLPSGTGLNLFKKLSSCSSLQEAYRRYV